MTDQKSLHKKTVDLMKQNNAIRGTGKTVKEISHGTSLTEGWLNAFKQGKIKQPSVDKVQELYEYLTEKPLAVS